jgi:hypothetical protein
MRAAAIFVIVAGLLMPATLLAALPRGLDGRWVGAATTEVGEGPVRVTLRDGQDGFVLDLAVPGIPPLRASMVPTDLAGVFEPAASRGLFGFFDSGRTSNPFDGAPLIWARHGDDGGLVAYRLTIAGNGGATLLRIALQPVGEGLEMRFEQRLDGSPPERWQTVLERRG